MCRLIVVRDDAPFDPTPVLQRFAATARTSREYQGDGWGCAWMVDGRWERYRSVTPIWDDDLDRVGATSLLIAHARSAFRNEGVTVANNMPFVEDDRVFAFNGELRGVRIAEEGATGAAKLFRMLVRIGGHGTAEGLERGLGVIAGRTRYVRAMNLIVADGSTVLVATRFGEDPDYFTLHRAGRGTRRMVASDPIDAETDWTPIPNHSVLALS